MNLTKLVHAAFSTTLTMATFALGPSAHANPETFTATGSAQFAPWTTPDYCEEARRQAELAANQHCASGQATRQSNYAEQIGFGSGHGPMTCTVKAEYRCE